MFAGVVDSKSKFTSHDKVETCAYSGVISYQVSTEITPYDHRTAGETAYMLDARTVTTEM
mgnify:CR=1 FL=1